MDLRLCFGGGEKHTLMGYSNPYMVRGINSRNSTTSYFIKFS